MPCSSAATICLLMGNTLDRPQITSSLECQYNLEVYGHCSSKKCYPGLEIYDSDAEAVQIVPMLSDDLILSFFSLQFNSNDDYETRNYVQVSKHELSSCALVCRSWTPMCQREIFEEIEIRSKEDVLFLFNLVSANVQPWALNL